MPDGVCQCEVYETCDECRGTDRDCSLVVKDGAVLEQDERDEVFIGYENDIPCFVPRKSKEGQEALRFQLEKKEATERAELVRLKAKYEQT